MGKGEWAYLWHLDIWEITGSMKHGLPEQKVKVFAGPRGEQLESILKVATFSLDMESF